MTPMRSASANASSWSCVTSTVVIFSSRCTWRIVRRSSSRILASSAPNGSSSSSTCGLCASARATATRCCWPPESCVGSRSSMPSSATSRSSSLRRCAAVGGLHAPHAQRELDVLAHRHVPEQRVVLEHQTDTALARRDVRDVVDRAARCDRDRRRSARRSRAAACSCRCRWDRAARRTRLRRLRARRR